MAKLKLEDVEKVIKEKNARWKAKENPISLLEEDKQKKLLGAKKPEKVDEDEMPSEILGAGFGFSLEKDWRTTGNVTPIKDQGNCGSCVSFGTISTIESMVSIEKAQQVDLSEADLHFCSSHGANCDGWWPSSSFASVKSIGVTDENCFPYNSAFVGGVPVCNCCSDKANRIYKVTNTSAISTATDAKNYISSIGPLAAAIDVYADFFNYGSGVYHHVTGTYQGGHCIAVVGYSEAEQCWICKNSWGLGWGDNGYFKIAYGDSNIDYYQKFGATGVLLPGTPPPPSPTLTVVPTSVNVGYIAGMTNLQVTSNQTWTVSSNQTWCTLTVSSGSGNGSVLATYTANTSTTSTRSAIVKFVGGSSTVSVSITQSKAPKKKGRPL